MQPSSNPPRAVIIHFCTFEAVTGSACAPGPSPSPCCCHAGAVKGEEGWRYLHEPDICSIIISPPLSGECLSLNLISHLLCQQGTTSPRNNPASDTSRSDMPASPWATAAASPALWLSCLSQRLAKLYVTLRCFFPLCPVTVFTAGSLRHRDV